MLDYGAVRIIDRDGSDKWRIELNGVRKFFTKEQYQAWTSTKEATEIAAAVEAAKVKEAAARVASKRKHAQFQDTNAVASRQTKRKETHMAQKPHPGSSSHYHNAPMTAQHSSHQSVSTSKGPYQTQYYPTPTPSFDGYSTPESFDPGFQYPDQNHLPTPAMRPSNVDFSLQGAEKTHQGQQYDYSAFYQQNGLEAGWDLQQTFAPQMNFEGFEGQNLDSEYDQEDMWVMPDDIQRGLGEDFDTTGLAWEEERRQQELKKARQQDRARQQYEYAQQQDYTRQQHEYAQYQEYARQKRHVPLQYPQHSHTQDYPGHHLSQQRYWEQQSLQENPRQKKQRVQNQHYQHDHGMQPLVHHGHQQNPQRYHAQTEPHTNVSHGSVHGSNEMLLQQQWSPQPEYSLPTSPPVDVNGAGRYYSGMPNSDEYLRNGTPVLKPPRPVRPVSEDVRQHISDSMKRVASTQPNQWAGQMPAVSMSYSVQDRREFAPTTELQYPQRGSGRMLVAPGSTQVTQQQQFVPQPAASSGYIPPIRKRKHTIDEDGFQETSAAVKRSKRAHEGTESTASNTVAGPQAAPGTQVVPAYVPVPVPHPAADVRQVTAVQPVRATPSVVAPLSTIVTQPRAASQPAPPPQPADTTSAPPPPSRKRHATVEDDPEEEERPVKRMKVATAAPAPAHKKGQLPPEEDPSTVEHALKFFSPEDLATMGAAALMSWLTTDQLRSKFKPVELKAIFSTQQRILLGMHDILDDYNPEEPVVPDNQEGVDPAKAYEEEQDQHLRWALVNYLASDEDGGQWPGYANVHESNSDTAQRGEEGKGDMDTEKKMEKEAKEEGGKSELDDEEWTAYLNDEVYWKVAGGEGLYADVLA